MTQEAPERPPETDPEEAAKVAQLCVREDNGDRLEDAAHALLSYARQLKAQGGADD
jgi:hypothetical protein